MARRNQQGEEPVLRCLVTFNIGQRRAIREYFDTLNAYGFLSVKVEHDQKIEICIPMGESARLFMLASHYPWVFTAKRRKELFVPFEHAISFKHGATTLVSRIRQLAAEKCRYIYRYGTSLEILIGSARPLRHADMVVIARQQCLGPALPWKLLVPATLPIPST